MPLRAAAFAAVGAAMRKPPAFRSDSSAARDFPLSRRPTRAALSSFASQVLQRGWNEKEKEKKDHLVELPFIGDKR
jgi:hypothetical protein